MDNYLRRNVGVPLSQSQTTPMADPWTDLNPNSSYSQFESSLSSTVSSPVALCEFIGSPPKLQFPINLNLGDPASLAEIAADPAFIERAAKFSCFSTTRCKTSPIGHGSGEQPSNVKLPQVSSSPALKPPNGYRNSGQNLAVIKPAMAELDRKSPGSAANSNEESSVSDQIETATEANSRKRKGASRRKSKEEESASIKVDSDDGNAKRSRPTESEKLKADKKPLEPPKGYIHVRARRGQATDSHSLAERVRREKISERMKLLQDLVPGCNKITGKALMLDEIINYVQSLQRQVEFLSMKLASVNPSYLDFNMENLLSKDVFQQHHNTSLPQPQMYPLDASANVYKQNVEQELPDAYASRGALADPSTRHFPCLDGFSENLPQFPGFIEDDLHSIMQMGFVHNSVNFPDMKVER